MSDHEWQRWLQRIEAKLDKIADDHEKRIRWVERVLYVASGLAVSSGAVSLATFLGGGAV